jgi:hypothetical protein
MNEDDKKLAVKFYKKAIHQKFESEKEGRQIYKDVDYVKIRVPGDKFSVVDKPVTDKEKERFSIQWENYQNKQAAIQEGTPIDMLPGISPAIAETYRANHIETIEQLSGVSEQAIKRLGMGARDLVNKAKKFLEGDSYSKRLENEIDILKKEIEELKKRGATVVNGSVERKKPGPKPKKKPVVKEEEGNEPTYHNPECNE